MSGRGQRAIWARAPRWCSLVASTFLLACGYVEVTVDPPVDEGADGDRDGVGSGSASSSGGSENSTGGGANEPSLFGVPIRYPEPSKTCSGEPQSMRLSDVPCGKNGRGAFWEECSDGEWLLGAQCHDVDECVDATRRETQQGCGIDGTLWEICRMGRWTPGDCLDDSRCETGEERIGPQPCGINARGFQGQVCQSGVWVERGWCDDPDECRDGEQRPGTTPCGVAGTWEQICKEGRWTRTSTCLSTRGCAYEPERQGEACEGGGYERLDCEDGEFVVGRDCFACGDVKNDKGLRIESNEDLEQLRGVTWSTGWIRIEDGVTSLDALSSLQCVESLSIRSNSLSDLSGLESLREAQLLWIDVGDSFTSLHGLEGLRILGTGNSHPSVRAPALEDISALSWVRRMGHLTFIDTPIADFSGLSGLEFARSLEVKGGPMLARLEGLADTELGRLRLQDVPALVDVSALSELDSIHELWIRDAPQLTTLPDDVGRVERLEIEEAALTQLPDFATHGPGRFVTLSDLPLSSLKGLALREGGQLRMSEMDGIVTLADASLGVLRSLQSLHLEKMEQLTSLRGLESLSELEELFLQDNPALTFEGFPPLASSRSVTMRGLSALEDFDGFDVVGYDVRGSWLLQDMPQLLSFDGMTGVDSVTRMQIHDCPQLEDLDAFAGLQVGGLSLEGVPALSNIAAVDGFVGYGELRLIETGIESFEGWLAPPGVENFVLLSNPELQRVAVDFGFMGRFEIKNNPALESLSLSKLATSGVTQISENARLTSLELPRLRSAESFRVENNPNLPTCQAQEISERFVNDRVTISISDNASDECSPEP